MPRPRWALWVGMYVVVAAFFLGMVVFGTIPRRIRFASVAMASFAAAVLMVIEAVRLHRVPTRTAAGPETSSPSASTDVRPVATLAGAIFVGIIWTIRLLFGSGAAGAE